MDSGKGKLQKGDAVTTYGRWQSLDHYLRSRARDRDTNLTQISEDLKWGRSYLNSIADEQFRPSIDRCRALAEYFDDDPAIILTLAGYMEPPPEETEISDAVARATKTLSLPMQRMVLDLVEFLKTRKVALTTALNSDQLLVELPDGRTFMLDVEGDLSEIDDHILRVTLRAALNATLSQ